MVLWLSLYYKMKATKINPTGCMVHTFDFIKKRHKGNHFHDSLYGSDHGTSSYCMPDLLTPSMHTDWSLIGEYEELVLLCDPPHFFSRAYNTKITHLMSATSDYLQNLLLPIYHLLPKPTFVQ